MMFIPIPLPALMLTPHRCPPHAARVAFARLAAAAVLLVSLVVWPAPVRTAHAQGHPGQPLIIVVRDGAGHPLPGIALDILLAGPPHEPYDNCVTDQAGQCTLIIPPGAYVIHFQRGWRGREFIPTGEQNTGALNDGGSGGFGIYLEPGSSEQIVTFVVGQDRETGRLVPLWDMSRDPDAPPQPFVYGGHPLASPDEALADISLDALDTAITGSVPQADLDATATAQVLLSSIDPGWPVEESAEATIDAEATPQQEPRSPPGDAAGLGFLGLVSAACLLTGLGFFLRALRRKRSGEEM